MNVPVFSISIIVYVTFWLSYVLPYRYDADMKKLKHMRPLPQKLLQSLNGELDFLGPYLSVLSLFTTKLFHLKSWN